MAAGVAVARSEANLLQFLFWITTGILRLMSNTGELESALQRARVAQQAWGAMPLSERLRPIAKLRARLAADPIPLAEVVANEIGKTRFEAIGAEVLPLAEACAFLIHRAPRLLKPRKETLRGTMPFSGVGYVHHVPWGVVASMVPWNYPLFLCGGPALNALAAGNAIVMKPSPRAKRTVAAFGEWLYDAGIPPDLAPVLDSSDETGRQLSASPLIDRIVFTGSSKTGRSVLIAAAQNLVPATIELSGYDAVFVLEDADVPLAAAAVAFGLRFNAGRTCVCPRRVFVQKKVSEPFVKLLSERLTKRKLPEPMDPQTLREADELAAKLESVPNIKNLNGRVRGDAHKALAVLGGREALEAAQGNFVPALVVTQVENTDEALRLEHESPYALGASIFTRSQRSADTIAAQLRSGMVVVNECITAAGEASMPFGGAKESGYGVRSGVEGLMEMTRPQGVSFARGTFRPHHDAGPEAEAFLLELLKARHSGSFFGRVKGWIGYFVEGAKWKKAED
jgi:acyl-CoA reductase-like NAD-dependent aldehyde dehydrogenase